VTDRARRARVALIGGDAQRLRQLRLFLDGLGVFEAIAIVSGAAGVTAIGRQQWDAALLVDDLHDMPVEVVVGRARAARYRGPFVGVTLTADRTRIVALHAAEMQEIVVMNAAPGPEIARALARAIERHELVSRITDLEQELAPEQCPR